MKICDQKLSWTFGIKHWFEKPVDGEQIKNLLKDAGWKSVDIRVFSSNHILVRLQSEVELKTLQKQISEFLASKISNKLTIEKIDSVSPKVGKLLRSNSIKAIFKSFEYAI